LLPTHWCKFFTVIPIKRIYFGFIPLSLAFRKYPRLFSMKMAPKANKEALTPPKAKAKAKEKIKKEGLKRIHNNKKKKLYKSLLHHPRSCGS
jgi:hypothetical protein